jgi:plastocyanin
MKILIGIIVILVLIVGGYFLFTHKASAPTEATPVAQVTPTTDTTQAPAAATDSGIAPPASKKVTITYTDSGFSPKSVSVTAGTEITWINKSSSGMWVASNPHPVHTGYDGTSVSEHCVSGAPTSANTFDECTLGGNGAAFTFTANKVGSWGYHNHANHDMTGTVVVTAS